MLAVPLRNPLRPVILAAARSPRIERTLSELSLTRHLVERFVPGESQASVLDAVRRLLASGRFISVDYLGEDTTDEAQARATLDSYLSLLAAYDGLAPRTGGGIEPLEVSVKLSALGMALPGNGREVALEHARTICRAAVAIGAGVSVDAEDAASTELRLGIIAELRSEFPVVGTVLQSYLHRTEDDCRELSAAGARVRLCKGAYAEPAEVAYQKPAEVDDSYRRCLKVLMAGAGYPMVATHDPAMIDAAEAEAAAAGRAATAYEFQMLYGVRDAEQRRLVGAGRQVRVYVPFGDQWYGYLMRRLAERPANLTFFLRSLVSSK